MKHLILGLLLNLLILPVASANLGISYHGRILKMNNQPVEGAIKFRIQIYSPSADKCLMYEEEQTHTIADGVFSLTIGRGQRVASTIDGGYSFDKIFSNRGTFSFSHTNPSACLFGSSYSPNSADSRIVKVLFNDGSGWDIMPEQALSWTPFAISAHSVGGFSKDELLRVEGGTAAPFTPSDFQKLQDLIQGTSSSYATQSSVNTALGNLGPLATMATSGTASASTYLRGDGQWASLPSGGGASPDPIGVTAPITNNGTTLGLAIGNGLTTNSGNLVVNTGTGALQIPQLDSNGKLSTSVIPSIPGAAPSGSGHEIQFRASATTFGSNVNFVWDNNIGSLGIGISTPRANLNIVGSRPIMLGNWAGGTGMNQHQSISHAPTSSTDSLLQKPFTLIAGNAFLDQSEVLIGGSTNADEESVKFIRFFTDPDRNTLRGKERMTIGPDGRIDINGPNVNPGWNTFGNLNISSNDPVAANLGGSLTFSGVRNSGERNVWASIEGRKDDANNNANGYLIFRTDQEGTGLLERLRITSQGLVGIGTSTPQTKLQVAGVISPSANNTYSLGNSTYRFTEVFATNGAVNTSDRREKKNISDSNLGLEFIMNLRPVSYEWNTGVDSVTHYGLIAQEAESTLEKTLGQSQSTSIVTYDKEADRYGVRYSELIAPLIKSVQELYKKITQQDISIADQNRKIASIDEEKAEKSALEVLKNQNELLKQENQNIKSYLCQKDPTAPFCN